MHNKGKTDLVVKSRAPALSGTVPTILCLSGHDPSGGAGIHADIESIAAQGAHALSVLTALTVQDTGNVRRVMPIPAAEMAAQLEVLLADCRPAALKIGLLGDADQVDLIAALIDRLQVPVVLDPVLRAGGGTTLVDSGLQAALVDILLPRVEVLTPNAAEARRLTGCTVLEDAGAALLARGARHVLITGGDEPGDTVCNMWCSAGQAPQRFAFERIPQQFHGAGCTLAAALAARLARGDAVPTALLEAMRYTQGSLQRSRAIGAGRRIPWRWS